MGVGSLLGGLVSIWSTMLRGPSAYLPLFALTLVVSGINCWQISRLPEAVPGSAHAADAARSSMPGGAASAAASDPPEEARLRREENRGLALLVGTNAVNALGVGLFGPLLPYWFSVRFGVGPGAIGSLFGLTFVLTALASVVMGELADRIGLVRSIVYVRLIGVAMLVAIPLVPSLGLSLRPRAHIAPQASPRGKGSRTLPCAPHHGDRAGDRRSLQPR